MTKEIDGSDKNCPICCQHLPLSEFGVCRARPDGRNLYCKSCIRKKVTDSRRALKDYRSSRGRGKSLPSTDQAELPAEGETPSPSHYPRMLSQMSPVDRVREVIKGGARTQKEIRKGAQLSDDEVGDALANLLLWTREIRTELVDNTRRYFINEPRRELARYGSDAKVPHRKMDVPSSFSALQGLMPGKRPEGEPEKIGGWVAA